MSAFPAQSLKDLSRQWVARLSHFRAHQNDEHRESLVDEACRFVGIQLENELSSSPFWATSSLMRRVAVLLYLVDRGVVRRTHARGRTAYQPTPDAELWVQMQPNLAPYLVQTLEFIAALSRLNNRASQRSNADSDS